MFKNILSATYLSPRSHSAMQTAVRLAVSNGAKLTVLNVHEEFMDKSEMVMLRVSVDKMQEHFRETALKARALMADEIAQAHVDKLDVKYLLHEGKADEVILKTTDEIVAANAGGGETLVIMGTNGRDSISDHILGTVAERVVRQSRVPVMVIPFYEG